MAANWIERHVKPSAENMGRVTFAFVCFGLELILCTMAGIILFIFTDLNFIQAGMTVVALWFFFLAATVGKFLVSVPEVTALLTIDVFTGTLNTYLTGIHFRYPWEQVKVGNYINLRIRTEEVVETYPSLDGPIMKVKWSFQYRAIPLALPIYIEADDKTIRKGLSDVGSSSLSASIGKTPADDCKKNQADIEEKLKGTFSNMKSPSELYGIELVAVSLADVDYEDSVQAARAEKARMQKVYDMADELMAKDKSEKLTYKEALDRAMAANGMLELRIQGVEGGNSTDSLLMAALGRGGN